MKVKFIQKVDHIKKGTIREFKNKLAEDLIAGGYVVEVKGKNDKSASEEISDVDDQPIEEFDPLENEMSDEDIQIQEDNKEEKEDKLEIETKELKIETETK